MKMFPYPDNTYICPVFKQIYQVGYNIGEKNTIYCFDKYHYPFGNCFHI